MGITEPYKDFQQGFREVHVALLVERSAVFAQLNFAVFIPHRGGGEHQHALDFFRADFVDLLLALSAITSEKYL